MPAYLISLAAAAVVFVSACSAAESDADGQPADSSEAGAQAAESTQRKARKELVLVLVSQHTHSQQFKSTLPQFYQGLSLA